MTYLLSWSDSSLKPAPITLANNVINDNTLSIVLTGKGAVNWGLPLQQNLMHVLENFASNGTAPLYATIGQEWYNAATKRLNVNTAVGWAELAYRRIDSAMPPPPPSYSGDTWYDTTNHYLNVYDSTGSGAWNRVAFWTQAQGNYSIEQPGSAANAYIVTLVPAITAYSSNFEGRFKVAHANTAGCTINAGGGVVPLLNQLGGALVAGDLQTGQIVSYAYVFADNKAYVTSITQSQTDTRYAKLAGLNTQNFNVATVPLDATVHLVGMAPQVGLPLAANVSNSINITQTDARYAPISAANSLVPLGTVLDFAGPTANIPTGFLPCDGRSLSTTTYADLFAVLGYTWGGAGGNFSLPNFIPGYAALAADPNAAPNATNAVGWSDARLGAFTGWVGQLLDHHHQYTRYSAFVVQSGSSTPCWYGASTVNTYNLYDVWGRGPTQANSNYAAGQFMLKMIKATR